MIVQTEVWFITLAGIGIVALAFLYVIVKSGKPADSTEVQQKAAAIRPWWFLALVLLGVGVTWASLAQFPIPDQHAQSQPTALVVNAVAKQWTWELSQKQYTAGTPVEFRVTSADVNHGFAIYDPDGHIVTQTQAMPGYTNRVVHTFAKPGKYRVLCLEYCGLAHHNMVAQFDVVARAGGN
jgi:cytochrome c oxidase subunit 2